MFEGLIKGLRKFAEGVSGFAKGLVGGIGSVARGVQGFVSNLLSDFLMPSEEEAREKAGVPPRRGGWLGVPGRAIGSSEPPPISSKLRREAEEQPAYGREEVYLFTWTCTYPADPESWHMELQVAIPSTHGLDEAKELFFEFVEQFKAEAASAGYPVYDPSFEESWDVVGWQKGEAGAWEGDIRLRGKHYSSLTSLFRDVLNRFRR